jgi:hypothetical protein
MQDIHDIRPPVQVGMDPALLKAALIVLALVLLAVGAFFALGYFRRKRSTLKSNLPMLPPPPPPLEAALDGLNRLDDPMVADPRLFYFRLTEIIKRFLGKKFIIKAPEMNTQELIPALKGLGLDRELFSDIREFLLFSDRIKYAGEAPPSSAMEVHLTFARTFVTLVDQKLAGQKEEEKDGERESQKKKQGGTHV